MSALPPNQERSTWAKPDPKTGRPTFEWTTTRSDITDTVRLVAGPFSALPVIFVPGIMGSNLKTKDKPGQKGFSVWRLDTTLGQPLGLASDMAGQGAGARQKLLHPDRCEVDREGATPKKPAGSVSNPERYKERGWGTVGQGSYHEFLLWLEEQLNPVQRNPALWLDYFQAEATLSAPPEPNAQPKLFPGIKMGMKGEPFGAEKQPFNPIMTDDLMARAKFLMPVYAEGYNWLDSNQKAAEKLQVRIGEIINEWNKGEFHCEQVILVTHSMGGLVARACAKLPGMADKIAGIVHGVMPAVGAAVAYRRCKVGMRDESLIAGMVIGSTGKEVTAVFAQAPGALQLLPAQGYRPGWLRVHDAQGRTVLSLPANGSDPYSSIYGEKDSWWGLINQAWLRPAGGDPITWEDYKDFLGLARKFHEKLGPYYHPNTFAYYGSDPKHKSFENVTWRVKSGIAPDDGTAQPNVASLLGMKPTQLRVDGSSPEYVGGRLEVISAIDYTHTYESSHWELHCEMQDGVGDGTVPHSSGAAPLAQGGGSIRQQFKLIGFDHEKSYKNGVAQRATLFAINKIAGTARRTA